MNSARVGDNTPLIRGIALGHHGNPRSTADEGNAFRRHPGL